MFNAARATWRNFGDEKTAGQRLDAHQRGGHVGPVDLTALNGGAGDMDITWPHWAPGDTNDYYWIVFSSERDYGHEVTAANTDTACIANGVKQCKQIWIGAIAKNKLERQPSIRARRRCGCPVRTSQDRQHQPVLDRAGAGPVGRRTARVTRRAG